MEDRSALPSDGDSEMESLRFVMGQLSDSGVTRELLIPGIFRGALLKARLKVP